MVTLNKRNHWAREANGRPRTNEIVTVTRDNGDRVRYEFDYADGVIYVYAGIWPIDWPNGIGAKVQLPVRAIPMHGWHVPTA